jgi:hypothetical protein
MRRGARERKMVRGRSSQKAADVKTKVLLPYRAVTE